MNIVFHRHFKLIFLAGCFAATAALAAEVGVTDNSVVLGSTVSLNGGKNSYAVTALQGMSLYFRKTNDSGGVNGRKVVQRVLDDEGKPEIAEANARKLLQEGAFILFGSVDGGPSSAVIKVANESKVPLFGPLSGAPTLRAPHQALVFPVRAEHKSEFRALLVWGKNTGYKTAGFLHTDSDGGRLHLENLRAIGKELGIEVVLALPTKSDATDAQIDDMAKQIAQKQPAMFISNGPAAVYQKLVTKSKTNGVRATFMGVNSGSSQIAKNLGPIARGMVFAQVMPNPMTRKHQITREYQDAALKADPKAEFSYGALEGYVTAKAMVAVLRETGRQLTRSSLLKNLEDAQYDLGGVKLLYLNGNHEGSRFVDLSIVARDGKFIQ